MSALLNAPTILPSAWRPAPRLWTCEEFDHLGEAGFLNGVNAILVHGEILTMPIANPPHDRSITLAMLALQQIFGTGYFPRVQSGLPVDDNTNLVPDLAMIAGTPRDYPGHPTSAALVVEVAASSLAYDSGEKSQLYSAAGIPEYWVIDVVGLELHVFREPIADAAILHGYRYAFHGVIGADGFVAPLAFTDKTLRVADLLP